MNNITSMFNGIVGRIEPGCCRLSLNGRIAVKTPDGYKVYNPKTGSVTNCSNFVLDLADDMFMVVPTRNLKPGHIILINGKPVYVLETLSKNRVKVMQYEDSSIKEVIPERHPIMGRKFYGRIVSLFGNGFSKGKGGFFKNMLKLKMMGAMFGGGDGVEWTGGNSLAMMMLMGGGSFDGIFEGICDDEDEDSDEDGDDEVTFTLFNDGDDDDEEEVSKPKKTGKAKKAAVRKRK